MEAALFPVQHELQRSPITSNIFYTNLRKNRGVFKALIKSEDVGYRKWAVRR
jgi:hypothetical protein